jgi:hypothetical protein
MIVLRRLIGTLTWDRSFDVLFVVLVVLAVLGATDVAGDWVATATLFAVPAGLIVVLAVLGGPLAKTGILVLVLMTAIGAGPRLAPEGATVEFYSASAQVIPVLLLALAIEVRLFRLRWLQPLRRKSKESWVSFQQRRLERDGASFARAVVVFVAVFILVAGELEALRALSSRNPEREPPDQVYTAVLLGLIAVGFLALFGVPHAEVRECDKELSWRVERHAYGRAWVPDMEDLEDADRRSGQPSSASRRPQLRSG